MSSFALRCPVVVMPEPKNCLGVTFVHGDDVERRGHGLGDATGHGLAGEDLLPRRARREVHLPRRRALRRDRCHQVLRAEHVLIVDPDTRLVRRELPERTGQGEWWEYTCWLG
eukprot:SAG22_NODE_47_length_24699_cov_13.602317_2_plen_113_part_00